ncbi:hypothetical protein BDV18DRAFT_2506 [Aspergillus unguis]
MAARPLRRCSGSVSSPTYTRIHYHLPGKLASVLDDRIGPITLYCSHACLQRRSLAMLSREFGITTALRMEYGVPLHPKGEQENNNMRCPCADRCSVWSTSDSSEHPSATPRELNLAPELVAQPRFVQHVLLGGVDIVVSGTPLRSLHIKCLQFSRSSNPFHTPDRSIIHSDVRHYHK